MSTLETRVNAKQVTQNAHANQNKRSSEFQTFAREILNLETNDLLRQLVVIYSENS
jgi:hypothetical protein